MDELLIIKVGGNVIDDEKALASFLKTFADLPEKKILVHGGGKLASRLAEQLNIPQQMVEGRRITDEETLKIVTMVYGGYINKSIVANLQSRQCNALGICGTDGNAVVAHKRVSGNADFGFVGDIDKVNDSFFIDLLNGNLTPVVAPITHDGKGQLLNTNADTIAGEIALALSAAFEVTLIYTFEKKGVLQDMADENSVIEKIDPASYKKLKDANKINAGMIPKLENAFSALDKGVTRVVIGHASELSNLSLGKAGTTITNE